MATIKKIAVIGPESTGKSTLCEQLAIHYDTVWCPEFAREYLTKWGPKYSYGDLVHIARTQLEQEDLYLQLAKDIANIEEKPVHPYFIDTEMTVMKVWSEFVFGRVDPFIASQFKERSYDLYFLCDIDLEWTDDPLREYPHLEDRQALFGIYSNLMKEQDTPWYVISGKEEDRLATAIQKVEELLKN